MVLAAEPNRVESTMRTLGITTALICPGTPLAAPRCGKTHFRKTASLWTSFTVLWTWKEFVPSSRGLRRTSPCSHRHFVRAVGVCSQCGDCADQREVDEYWDK